MNIKKILITSIILMFLLTPLAFASDGDYTIPSAIKDITINDDGSVLITEEIVYDIDGTVNGVYRDIPITGNQEITNITVKTPGFYNTVETIHENNKTRIKVWLYKDSAKTKKTKDAKVVVTYNYTFNKGVKIYNDIAEFQYMTWGNEWDTGVNHLESTIHLSGNNMDVEYWDNPDDYITSSNWNTTDTLTTTSDNIPSHTSYEQRILMPKTYFKSTENAEVINMDAKAQIEQDQAQYQKDRENQKITATIFTGILTILMLIPAGIYLIYGREPKINYKAEYEYDIPTKETPIQVNSIMSGDVGVITNNGIYTTILDLIHQKYLKVISSNDEDTIIKQTNKDQSKLKPHEQTLLSYLSTFAVNDNISLKSIGDTETPEKYNKFKESWVKQAEQEVPESLIKRYFNDKGSKIFTKYTYLLLVLGILSLLSLVIITIPKNFYWIIGGLSAILIIESIIMICIPNTFAGRWTPQGKEVHDKWKNFEKYLKDFSLIKEHPPASIEIWGKYLVYATALGCAKEVSKNMKKYFDLKEVPEDHLYDLDVIFFVYYGGFDNMDSSFSSLTVTDSDSSGINDVGGGFGGGGGGTF